MSINAPSGPPVGAPDEPSPDYPVGAEIRDRVSILLAVDRLSLARLHVPPRALYIAVALAALFFGLVRTNVYHTDDIPGRPILAFLYIGSIVFLTVGLTAGLLSRIAGMVFLIVFSISDLISFLLPGSNAPGVRLLGLGGFGAGPSLMTGLGRLISYALLAILVVSIPTIQRSISTEFAARRLGRLVVGPLVSGLATGFMFLGWASAAPYLIRPVFSNRRVPVQEITVLQEHIIQLAVGAGLLALVVALLLRARPGVESVRVAIAPWRRWMRRLGPLRLVVNYALAIGFLAGIISGWTDVLILAGAGLIAEIGAGPIGRRFPTYAVASRLPTAARIVLTPVLALGIAALVGVVAPDSFAGSDFFPLVLASALAIVAFRWLFVDPRSASRDAPKSRTPGVVAAIGAPLGTLALLVMAQLILPTVVLADDCSSWADCRNGHSLFAAIFLWLVLLALPYAASFLWSWLKGIFVPDPIPEGLASPEGAEAQRGALDLIKKVVANKALADGDTEEYSRIMNESAADFANEVRSGKYAGTLSDTSATQNSGISIGGRSG